MQIPAAVASSSDMPSRCRVRSAATGPAR